MDLQKLIARMDQIEAKGIVEAGDPAEYARAQQQMARVQAVDAQLVEAGLMDPRNLMADDAPVFGPAPVQSVSPIAPLGNEAPAPTNPAGAPNIALPGGIAGF